MRVRYFIAILYALTLLTLPGCGRHANAQSPPSGPPSGPPAYNPGGAKARCNRRRVTTGAVNAGVYTDVVVAWLVPFVNTSYTVFCSVTDATSAQAGLDVNHIQSVAVGSVTVTVHNGSAGLLTGTVECIGIHD